MAINPIPKVLLSHSISYEEFDDSNGWGSNLKPAITINNVRVQPVSTLNTTFVRNDVEANSLIFIDRTYSDPYIELKEKSKVTFNGERREVVKVDTIYEFSETPHHFEVWVK